MGACVCKEKNCTQSTFHTSAVQTPQSSLATAAFGNIAESRICNSINRERLLILQTLRDVRFLIETDQEPPRSILLLHKIAETEHGWLSVAKGLISAISSNEPLGAVVISLLIEECPIPTKSVTDKFCHDLNLNKKCIPNKTVADRHRNICIIFGCLAEKMAGPGSVYLFNKNVLIFLMNSLNETKYPVVILAALVALEKFALTSDNKIIINEFLNHQMNGDTSPFKRLENFASDDVYLDRQIKFCASWCLDNLFLIPGRKDLYECEKTDGINAMLNSKDASEYLKISPNGLEARGDASSFESVRCTFNVEQGCWYYEVTIVTSGIMQIGWATKDSKFLTFEGYGIGDDDTSISYDGCRQLIWHGATATPHCQPCWKPGDILGLLLDVDKNEVIFSLNGLTLKASNKLFNNAKTGFFAAASFMSYQQCVFNFGATPFKYPPECDFLKFNDYGRLTEEDRIILPRRKRLALLQNTEYSENSCTLCLDAASNIILIPCLHEGFCHSCSLKLDKCPICRAIIKNRKVKTDTEN